MRKSPNKKDYIINKAHVPSFFAALALIFAIVWVGVVFFGVAKEFGVESSKVYTGKKIVFSLEGKEVNSNAGEPESDPVENGYSISVLLELEDFQNSDQLKKLPRGVTIGISGDMKDFSIIKNDLNANARNYLIKLPLVTKFSNDDKEIYPNIDPRVLSIRLNKLLSGSSAQGVYNLGNEEFLETDISTFANIISNLSKKNLLLLYGIHDKTTVFESDSENIFSVEACDKVVDLTKMDKLQLVRKLSEFEKMSTKKGKAILLIKAKNVDLPEELISWLVEVESRNFKIVSFNQLPKTLIRYN